MDYCPRFCNWENDVCLQCHCTLIYSVLISVKSVCSADCTLGAYNTQKAAVFRVSGSQMRRTNVCFVVRLVREGPVEVQYIRVTGFVSHRREQTQVIAIVAPRVTFPHPVSSKLRSAQKCLFHNIYMVGP